MRCLASLLWSFHDHLVTDRSNVAGMQGGLAHDGCVACRGMNLHVCSSRLAMPVMHRERALARSFFLPFKLVSSCGVLLDPCAPPADSIE
jgi:hypothetical protein